MKYLIPIIILVLLTTLIKAEIEISTDNTSWVDASQYGVEIYVENGTAIIDGLTESTLYYFRARNTSSNWTYTSQRTEEGVRMLSVTFPLTIFGVLFIGLGIVVLLRRKEYAF